MGNKPIYLANNIIKVDAGSKLTEDKELGITGFMNTFTIIKSRSNRAGQTLDVVYDQNRGYDNIYTNYCFLKSEKLTSGAGRSFALQGCDVKFSQKEFKKKLLGSAELQQTYKTLLASSLRQFIFNPMDEEVEEGTTEE